VHVDRVAGSGQQRWGACDQDGPSDASQVGERGDGPKGFSAVLVQTGFAGRRTAPVAGELGSDLDWTGVDRG
jgi:hypothetical protein